MIVLEVVKKDQVPATVYTSLQFGPGFCDILVEMVSVAYPAMRLALIIPIMIKQQVRRSGYALPERPEESIGPKLPEPVKYGFDTWKIKDISPRQKVWNRKLQRGSDCNAAHTTLAPPGRGHFSLLPPPRP